MEYVSPPFCVEQKHDFMLDSSEVGQTTNKDQNTNNTPPALVVSNAVQQAKLLSGQGSIGHSHPTHLKREIRLFVLTFSRNSVRSCQLIRMTSIASEAKGPSRTRYGEPVASSPSLLGRGGGGGGIRVVPLIFGFGS